MTPMQLTCPHCRKVVNVPDEAAGQVTNCPECRGPFMVPRQENVPAPAVAPAPAPVSATVTTTAGPTAGPAPFALANEPTPAPPAVSPTVTPAPTPAASTPTPAAPTEPATLAPPVTGDYQHRMALHLRPEIVRWLP